LLRSHNQAVANTPDTKTMKEYVIKQTLDAIMSSILKLRLKSTE